MGNLSWSGVLAIVLLVGCNPTRTTDPTPPPTVTPTAPTTISATGNPTAASPGSGPAAKPLPALRDDVIKGEVTDQLLTLVRPLVRRITAADGVRIMVRWDDRAPGAPAPDQLLAIRKVDWQATLSSLKLEVKKDGGTSRTLQVGSGPAREIGKTLMDIRSVAVLRFDAAGLHPGDGKPHRWATPSAKVFDGPGKYVVRLAGQLVLEAGKRAFSTGPLPLEVVDESPKMLPLSELEAIAAKHFAKLEGAKQDAKPRKATVEDVDGNRVVRFAYHSGMGEGVFVEVVLSPAGAVLHSATKTMFTCVAEGTRIESQRGAVPVEQLREGDRVWAYDPDGGKRVLTTVRAITATSRRQLVEVAPGLRVTAEHPVYADHRWVPAGELSAGALLLGADLRPTRAQAPRQLHTPSLVFDVSVEWPHTFFAGGVLVHNKAAATGAIDTAFGDDWDTLLFRASTKTEWDRQRKQR